jgi:hypothetical protein
MGKSFSILKGVQFVHKNVTVNEFLGKGGSAERASVRSSRGEKLKMKNGPTNHGF